MTDKNKIIKRLLFSQKKTLITLIITSTTKYRDIYVADNISDDSQGMIYWASLVLSSPVTDF